MLELDHHQPRQRQPEEGLSLAGTADSPKSILGVEPGAGNRRIADPARQLAVDAPGGHRDSKASVRIASHGADTVGAVLELLPLAIGDEDRRVAHLDSVLAREARRSIAREQDVPAVANALGG